jgi:hypothetical protein
MDYFTLTELLEQNYFVKNILKERSEKRLS